MKKTTKTSPYSKSQSTYLESKQNKLFWKDLQEKNLDVKLSLLHNHLELTKLLINELLEDEVLLKAGQRYARKSENYVCFRWGTNPSSVKIGENKIKVEVPRLREKGSNTCVPLERFEQMKELEHPSEALQAKIIQGLSTRDYAKISELMLDNFGLSKSSISDQENQRCPSNSPISSNVVLSIKKLLLLYWIVSIFVRTKSS